jgi:hypothetical protein
MTRSHSNQSASASRRFVLLPEDSVGQSGERPRIRRYQLASIGRLSASDGADIAMTRLAGELGRFFRSRR